MAEHEKWKRLGTFLADAFSKNGGQLRHFLEELEHGDKIVAELPGKDAPFTAQLDAAIQELESKGAADAAFFAALCEAIPRRKVEIEALARAFGHPPGPPHPPREPSPLEREPPVTWPTLTDATRYGRPEALPEPMLGV